MNYRPEWDIDRAFGEDGEDTVRRVLALDAAHVEVKRKRRCDDKFYVETHQSPGATGEYKPSGVNTTGAEFWAYLIGRTGVVVLVPTMLLKSAALVSRPVDETDGSNPTRGRLVSFESVLAAGRAAEADAA